MNYHRPKYTFLKRTPHNFNFLHFVEVCFSEELVNQWKTEKRKNAYG